MTRANLVIAKRDREDHLEACLRFINKANAAQDFDVVVYVIDEYVDCDEVVQSLKYTNIRVSRIKVPVVSSKFNKSRLLNIGFNVMRDNYDWVAVIDVDMAYRPHYFDAVVKHLRKSPHSTVTCKGFSLDSASTKMILGGHDLLPDASSNLRYNGNSQIAMTHRTVDLILNIYEELYCEAFEGWGGEDSDMSFRIKDMIAEGLLYHQKLDDMWCHLCHTKQSDLDGMNTRLFERRRVKNQKTLARWVHDKNKYLRSNM